MQKDKAATKGRSETKEEKKTSRIGQEEDN